MLQPPVRRTDPTVRAMIDQYIADGLHTRLPTTDARLLPEPRRLNWDTLTPHADAGTVYRAARTTRHRQPIAHENWPPSASIVTRVGPCPSAPGSSRSRRYELMREGATIGELRDAGLRLSDLTRYLGSRAVTLQLPGESTETQEAAEVAVDAVD